MTQPTNNNSGPGKQIDNLFRDSLGKQEISPSPKVWKSLNWKLLVRELIHFNFINVPGIALVSITGGIILVAALSFWAFLPGGRNQSENLTNQASGTIRPSATLDNNAGNSVKPGTAPGKISAPADAFVKPAIAPGKISTPVAAVVISTRPAMAPPKSIRKSEAMIASNAKIEKAHIAAESPAVNGVPDPAPTTAVGTSAVPVVASLANSEAKNVATAANTVSYISIQAMYALEFSNFDLYPSPDTLTFIRSGEVFKYVREKAPVPSFFSASLGIAPEMALYRSNGSSTEEFNYWANAGVAYHFSRFSIRTGIGLGYTYDEGNYKAQYLSNDSVSYYKEVIGYYPDPVNPGRIIYVTKDHAIYDSVTHMADDRTRNRYTYLQIPLLLGYNLFETRNFSLGIEAGPAVSFLIGEKKAQPLIDIPNGRLVALQDYSPAHQPTSWQLWVRLSLEYQFTRTWGLFINPYYKYSITSPTQPAEGGSRNTQAFGIDLGIQYMFGRKSNKK